MASQTVLDPGVCIGGLSIDGVDLMTGAWAVLDLTPLWLTPNVRGVDRLIPGVDGVKPFRRRVTVTQHSLPFIVNGQVNSAGAPYANPWIGLQTNLDVLRAGVLDPTGATDGTRAATLTMPDGSTRTANVHVFGLTAGQRVQYVQLFTLELSIPSGGFV